MRALASAWRLDLREPSRRPDPEEMGAQPWGAVMTKDFPAGPEVENPPSSAGDLV